MNQVHTLTQYRTYFRNVLFLTSQYFRNGFLTEVLYILFVCPMYHAGLINLHLIILTGTLSGERKNPEAPRYVIVYICLLVSSLNLSILYLHIPSPPSPLGNETKFHIHT